MRVRRCGPDARVQSSHFGWHATGNRRALAFMIKVPRFARRSCIRPIVAFMSLYRCVSPFERAIVAAIALHCVLIVHCWSISHKSTHSVEPTARKRTELQVELEDHSQVGNGPESSFSIDTKPAVTVRDDSARRATVAIGSLSPRNSTQLRSDSTQPPIPAAEGEQPLAESIPTGPSETATAVAMPKIDLGLNGGLLRMLDARAAATPAPKPGKPTRTRDSSAELTRTLNSAILADDVRHGRARGNVLLGVLDSALRSVGPTRGRAIVQATVDARGDLIDLVLLRGDSNEWASVLQSFRNQAKNRRVRVPDGAQGLRITFNVSAKVQRPSGEAVESTPIGVDGPSLAPNGMTMRGTFDLADLSNTSSRMISARIVSEELL